MTKYYSYTFRYYLSEVTITKAVTDKMEERPSWKKTFAGDWMTQTLRAYTKDNRCIHGYKLTEVSKKDMVPLKETLRAMEQAKEDFDAGEDWARYEGWMNI